MLYRPLDLHTLQICMNNCDTLYRPFGDQKRYTDMLNGTAYCRKSLNNLYFSSIAQNINDDLDIRTQQQNAANPYSIIEQIKAQQTKARRINRKIILLIHLRHRQNLVCQQLPVIK